MQSRLASFAVFAALVLPQLGYAQLPLTMTAYTVPTMVCLAKPTLAMCKDPAYFASTCGQADYNANKNNPNWACYSLLNSSAQNTPNQIVSLPTHSSTPMPSATKAGMVPEKTITGQGAVLTHYPLGTQQAKVSSYDFAANAVQGAVGTFDQRLAQTTAAAKSSWNSGQTTNPACGTTQTLACTGTEADVKTCVEYAFEKHFDFSRLENAAATSNHDARAIFNLAFNGQSGWGNTTVPGQSYTNALGWHNGWSDCWGMGGVEYDCYGFNNGNHDFKIAHLPMRQRSGDAMPSIPWSACMAKNAFYRTTPTSSSVPGIPCQVTESWGWHQQMSTALAGTSDEILNHLYLRQQDYIALLETKRLTYRKYEAAVAACFSSFQSPTCQSMSAVSAALTAIQVKIDAAKAEAAQYGCTPSNASTPTPCDWSPRLFAERLYSTYRPLRDADFRTCIAKTNDNLALLNAKFPAGSLNATKWYRRTPAMLDQFVTDLDAFYAAQLAGVPKYADGKAVTYQTHALMPETRNSDLFGVNYSYDLYWGIKKPTATASACASRPEARASLTLNTTVFGTQLTPFDGRVNVRGNAVNASVKVFNKDLLPAYPKTGWTQTFNFIDAKPSDTVDINNPSIPVFSILGITIAARAGLTGRAGLDLKLDLTTSVGPNGLCNTVGKAQIDGNLRPYATAEGFVEVFIDLLLLEAGIKGALTLLDVSLPFRVKVKAEATVATPNPQLTVESTLDYSLKALSGRLALFARLNLLFFSLYGEIPLVEWNGWEKKGSLFAANYTVQLNLVDQSLLTSTF